MASVFDFLDNQEPFRPKLECFFAVVDGKQEVVYKSGDKYSRSHWFRDQDLVYPTEILKPVDWRDLFGGQDPNEWQPIETAPKDGTKFLAYGFISNEFGVSFYTETPVLVYWNSIDECWRVTAGEFYGYDEIDALWTGTNLLGWTPTPPVPPRPES